MASNQNHASSERSKVRIFFIEGDFASGDLEQLTQVLTNATRPATILARAALPGRAAATTVTTAQNVEDENAESQQVDTTGEEIGDDVAAEPLRATKGPSKPRTYRKPQPVVDLDMSAGGKLFKDFAAEKGNPASHRTRYMVAATWLHEFAKVEPITIDHVFTCYKHVGWNFDIQDPTLVFRQLKAEGLASFKKGQFSLNHLGIGKVNDMK